MSENLVVGAIKQEIGKRSEDDQQLIRVLAQAFRDVLRIHGQNAALALALVGAEMAAEE